MEDMIKKVVDMDEKARELEAQAQQEKISITEAIEAQRKKVYDDYIEKARVRAQKNDEIVQENAEKQFAESQKAQQEIMEKLKERYDENSDKWVDEIVQRVIG